MLNAKCLNCKGLFTGLSTSMETCNDILRTLKNHSSSSLECQSSTRVLSLLASPKANQLYTETSIFEVFRPNTYQEALIHRTEWTNCAFSNLSELLHDRPLVIRGLKIYLFYSTSSRSLSMLNELKII